MDTINELETRLTECRTLPELQKAFTIEELLSLLKEKILLEWLYANFLDSQAKLLEDESLNRDALIIRLCESLAIDVTALSEHEANLVTAAVKRERDRLTRENECGKDGVIVTNQAELVAALRDKNLRKVYLYDDEFSIPTNRAHITYDGRNNAVINILARGNETLDFDGNEVYFYNLTIAFHYLEPSQVNINHSKQNHNSVIFLRADRIAQNDSVTLQEMANFLRGRMPFETVKNFAQRAEKFHGIIVGKVCLTDTDYDVRNETFLLKPIWRVEFTELIRRFVRNAKMLFKIPPEEAAQLYECGRVQLVYADFCTSGDDVAIAKIYLHADNGQGKIYPIYLVDPEKMYGSGANAYGLELISDYD